MHTIENVITAENSCNKTLAVYSIGKSLK